MATEKGRGSMIPGAMRVIFGIIMIIVYLGMGILILLNYFQWDTSSIFAMSCRWGGGVILVLYGIWRAIRQFWGIDSNL